MDVTEATGIVAPSGRWREVREDDPVPSEIASGNASLVRGHAWHAYPDPATPGVFAGGHTYLVLTEGPEPPAVAAGWSVEGARLSETFELDQRGGRSVRLIRSLGTAETGRGPVSLCEFQVDRG